MNSICREKPQKKLANFVKINLLLSLKSFFILKFFEQLKIFLVGFLKFLLLWKFYKIFTMISFY